MDWTFAFNFRVLSHFLRQARFAPQQRSCAATAARLGDGSAQWGASIEAEFLRIIREGLKGLLPLGIQARLVCQDILELEPASRADFSVGKAPGRPA